MSKIAVRIESSRPLFIEADADSFGQTFAHMSDEDQVKVFRAMVEHMKPHKIQWDYIGMALDRDENGDVRNDLSVIFPATHDVLQQLAAKDSEIANLRDALKKASAFIGRYTKGAGTEEIREIAESALAGGSNAAS